ncbi:sperm microtubule associated protein 2 [Centropristis striata]|uniref:sperm microtubule associated protein 2 n=1 Tax=Centropristis striata TaxID=184440 RepID=UPI0027E02D51|nr:sperm microtubule associated protein 2 [Centropristis striata]
MATRTQRLAQPKPDRLRYPDRRSVYWLDDLPVEKSGSTSRPARLPSGSPSPLWAVSVWALGAVPSDRLCLLARPRAPAAGWQPDRPVLGPLNRTTQTAVASSRICQLAQPRRRLQVLEAPGPRTRPGPPTHIPCRASAHIELLATPKPDPPGFKGERSVFWPVSRAARTSVASQRLVELSGPRERRGLFEGFDPYLVSRAARSASPSPRIQQLCLPLPRKCHSN